MSDPSPPPAIDLASLQAKFDASTQGEWGASDEMVVTPPNEERTRKMQAGEYPFTCRRVAICEESYYTPAPENLANVAFIASIHNAFPALAAELTALRERIAEFEKFADAHAECGQMMAEWNRRELALMKEVNELEEKLARVIGQRTVERMKRFTEKLESGEPIEATQVTQYETPDGPMHTFEKTTIGGKSRDLESEPTSLRSENNRLRKACEAAKAAIWDAHYGKGISIEYVRAVDDEILAALASEPEGEGEGGGGA